MNDLILSGRDLKKSTARGSSIIRYRYVINSHQIHTRTELEGVPDGNHETYLINISGPVMIKRWLMEDADSRFHLTATGKKKLTRWYDNIQTA